MKKLKHLALFGSVAALLLSSCTIEKRIYSSGYHVEWKGHHSRTTTSETSSVTKNDAIVFSSLNNDAENNKVTSSDLKTKEIKMVPVQQKKNTVTELRMSKNEKVVSQPVSSFKTKINLEKKQNWKKAKKATKASGGKSQIVALVLCFFLGLLGIHRFYLGYTGLGVLYLLTAGIFGIGWIIDIILLIIPNGLTPKGESSY